MNMSLRSASLAASALFCGGLVALAALAPIRAMLPDLGPELKPVDVVPDTPKTPPPKPPKQEEIRQRQPIVPDLQIPTEPPQTIIATMTTPETAVAPPAPALDIVDAFVQTPRGADFARLYPQRAIDRNISGKTTIHCYVRADGGVDCTVTEETPESWGFGAAALKAAKLFKVSPRFSNGQPTEGGTFTRTFYWRMQE
jgi:protein TonB